MEFCLVADLSKPVVLVVRFANIVPQPFIKNRNKGIRAVPAFKS